MSERMLPMRVVRYCALECERQRSGERSVWWMAQAWSYAVLCWDEAGQQPDLEAVLTLGRLVEPKKNEGGLRRVGVRVGHSVKMPRDLVPRALDGLLGAVGELEPDEWYRQYEEIHPFVDGNGRTGSLLWNWLRGTLMQPEDPPDFWKDERVKALKRNIEEELFGIPENYRRKRRK